MHVQCREQIILKNISALGHHPVNISNLTMLRPYQCLTVCHRATEHGFVKLFLAACGPQLLVVNADTSEILSVWSASEKVSLRCTVKIVIQWCNVMSTA